MTNAHGHGDHKQTHKKSKIFTRRVINAEENVDMMWCAHSDNNICMYMSESLPHHKASRSWSFWIHPPASAHILVYRCACMGMHLNSIRGDEHMSTCSDSLCISAQSLTPKVTLTVHRTSHISTHTLCTRAYTGIELIWFHGSFYARLPMLEGMSLNYWFCAYVYI
jgi:hypothetical protein